MAATLAASMDRAVGRRTHDECDAQTMAEHAMGLVGKHPVNLDGGIPAMRKQELERVFAPRQRVRIGFSGRRLCCVKSHCCVHGALHFGRGERARRLRRDRRKASPARHSSPC